MEAPSMGLSVQMFDETISQHIFTHYKSDNTEGMICEKCGTEIQQTTCFVSIHDKRFSGCTGDGEVRRVPLPYCPKCEGIPKRTSTCIHD